MQWSQREPWVVCVRLDIAIPVFQGKQEIHKLSVPENVSISAYKRLIHKKLIQTN